MAKKSKKKICGRGPSKAENKNSKVKKLLAWIRTRKRANKAKKAGKIKKPKKKAKKR